MNNKTNALSLALLLSTASASAAVPGWETAKNMGSKAKAITYKVWNPFPTFVNTPEVTTTDANGAPQTTAEVTADTKRQEYRTSFTNKFGTGTIGSKVGSVAGKMFDFSQNYTKTALWSYRLGVTGAVAATLVATKKAAPKVKAGVQAAYNYVRGNKAA